MQYQGGVAGLGQRRAATDRAGSGNGIVVSGVADENAGRCHRGIKRYHLIAADEQLIELNLVGIRVAGISGNYAAVFPDVGRRAELPDSGSGAGPMQRLHGTSRAVDYQLQRADDDLQKTAATGHGHGRRCCARHARGNESISSDWQYSSRRIDRERRSRR